MANNRKHNGLICLIIVLGALLHNTGAVQVLNKFVGDDVILQPKYSGVPSEITWRKNDMKVVLLVLIPQENFVFYFLEDRATINRTNGALTIKNLAMEDRGPFVAEVLVNDNSQYTRIFLDLHVPRTEYKTEGENVTLEPMYTGDPSEIKWMVNGSLLVKMSLKPRVEIIFYRFQDRATISPTDGIFTINELTIEDSGMYKAEVTVNDIIQETRIQVTVSKSSGLSGVIIALIVFLAVNLLIIIVLWKCYRKKYDCLSGGIIAPVVIVVLAVISIIIFIIIMWKYYNEESISLSGVMIAVIVVLAFSPIIIVLNVWYDYQKSKKSWEAAIKMTNATSTTGLSDEGLPKVSPGTLNEERGGNLTGEEDRSLLAQSQVKKVGDVITLKPQCIGDASKMNWKKDGNKLVDLELNPPWNPIFYRRLQDRATIDKSNGSLTIKDLTVADSGIYKVAVLVNGVYQYTKIPLTVRAMSQQIKWMEDDVTLVPKYIGDPSEINWKMNWDTLVEMKLKPRLVHFSHLQDRATISPTDGSLTIKNLTTEDSGLYEAEALVNGVYQKTDIILSVRRKFPGVWEEIITRPGSDLLLPIRRHLTLNHTDTEGCDRITWYYKKSPGLWKKIAGYGNCELSDLRYFPNTRISENGSLIISHVTPENDGLYCVDIENSAGDVLQRDYYIVHVEEDSRYGNWSGWGHFLQPGAFLSSTPGSSSLWSMT